MSDSVNARASPFASPETDREFLNRMADRALLSTWLKNLLAAAQRPAPDEWPGWQRFADRGRVLAAVALSQLSRGQQPPDSLLLRLRLLDLTASNVLAIVERGNFPDARLGRDWLGRQSERARQPRSCRGIKVAIKQMLAHDRDAKVAVLWEQIPANSYAPMPVQYQGEEFFIYRDGEEVVQVDGKGRSKTLGWRTFQRYVQTARNTPHE